MEQTLWWGVPTTRSGIALKKTAEKVITLNSYLKLDFFPTTIARDLCEVALLIKSEIKIASSIDKY